MTVHWSRCLSVSQLWTKLAACFSGLTTKLRANNWSTVIEQIFIHFMTEDMIKVCYSFHLQPPTYMQPSFLSQPFHTTRQYQIWLEIYRTTELGHYCTNALQNWTTGGQHASSYTWQGMSEWSLLMGQMNRVDQQKLEGSHLDEKVIPLTCVPQISMVWKSNGWDK